MKCVFRVSLQLLSKTFFILRRTERDMIKNLYCLHVKYIFCPILIPFIFLHKFSKNAQIYNFIKLHICKIKLKYNYCIIEHFSSKTPSTAYPTQGSLGQIRPSYYFFQMPPHVLSDFVVSPTPLLWLKCNDF